jgi:hypothetical protein
MLTQQKINLISITLNMLIVVLLLITNSKIEDDKLEFQKVITELERIERQVAALKKEAIDIPF